MKNDPRIHIESPCKANWKDMTPAENGKFCMECSKVVVDFTNNTLDEIKLYIAKAGGDRVCGRYEERHTTTGTRWHSVLNSIESNLSKVRLQRIVLFLISGMLVISGCRHKRETTVGYISAADKKGKQKQSGVERASKPLRSIANESGNKRT